jgi:hypothetical protein
MTRQALSLTPERSANPMSDPDGYRIELIEKPSPEETR